MARQFLEIGKRYLFRELGTGKYYEAKVLRFGMRDKKGDGGAENFALVKLLIDSKPSWVSYDSLEIQEQWPPDEQMEDAWSIWERL
jgi:hypothetical protein